ncbi:MAG: FtsX-like permease family protein [Vicinamibacterales bacterium]
MVLAPVRAGAGPRATPAARTSVWLLGLAGAVLLIGCANVAHLSVTRAIDRRRELGVRLALGISPRRLMAGAYVEACLLAIAGGLAALLVAHVTRLAFGPVLAALNLPEVSVFTDRRMLVVTGGVVAASAILIGSLPALFLYRTSLTALQARPRGATTQGRRSRTLLLATQVMLSVALLTGAGLFLRSLDAIVRAPLGYDPTGVVLLTRRIPPGGFDAEAQAAVRSQLLDTAAAWPGIESAAWVSSAPFVSTSSTDVFLPGPPPPRAAPSRIRRPPPATSPRCGRGSCAGAHCSTKMARARRPSPW